MCSEDVYRIVEEEVTGIGDSSTMFAGGSHEEECRV